MATALTHVAFSSHGGERAAVGEEKGAVTATPDGQELREAEEQSERGMRPAEDVSHLSCMA